MQIFGPNELLEEVLNRGLCIGCGACVELCPYFKTYKGRTSMLFPCTLTQGRCFAYCPKTEVDLDELASRLWGRPYEAGPLGRYEEVVRARAGAQMQKGPFQAGGTVSALMTLALKNGLIEAAVLTDPDGLTPMPRLATHAEVILACASSKYMAAPTLAALNQASKNGHSRLGLVATPCQGLALAQMRLNPLEREDFRDPAALVVGLFCTWALDTRKLASFLAETMDISQITGMDIPPPPAEVFIVEMNNKKIEIPLDKIRPLIPEGCHICPDMTSEWADVSVGVLEGEPEWNTLIIRTETGRKLVDEAVKTGYLQVEDMPQENLDHLLLAAGNKKMRAFTRAKEEGLLNTSEEGKRSALRLNEETIKEAIG